MNRLKVAVPFLVFGVGILYVARIDPASYPNVPNSVGFAWAMTLVGAVLIVSYSRRALNVLGRVLVLYPLQGLWHSVRVNLRPLGTILYPLTRIGADKRERRATNHVLTETQAETKRKAARELEHPWARKKREPHLSDYY